MLVKNTTYFFLVFILSILISGCKKAPNYAKEPTIQFDNLKVVPYTINDPDNGNLLIDSVFITIRFQDGDGDLGNNPVVSTYYDFFTDIYKKTNGVFIRMNNFDLTNDYNGYLPLLSPYTMTGPIDGKITFKPSKFDYITPPPDNSLFYKNDTLQFHVRIRDRAGNYSNWAKSNDYIIWESF